MEDEVIRVVVEQADKAGFPDYALTIFITVLSGVLVFAISEWLKEIWLTPLQNYKKLRGKVSRSLTMYACYYHIRLIFFDDFLNQNKGSIRDRLSNRSLVVFDILFSSLSFDR